MDKIEVKNLAKKKKWVIFTENNKVINVRFEHGFITFSFFFKNKTYFLTSVCFCPILRTNCRKFALEILESLPKEIVAIEIFSEIPITVTRGF